MTTGKILSMAALAPALLHADLIMYQSFNYPAPSNIKWDTNERSDQQIIATIEEIGGKPINKESTLDQKAKDEAMEIRKHGTEYGLAYSDPIYILRRHEQGLALVQLQV